MTWPSVWPIDAWSVAGLVLDPEWGSRSPFVKTTSWDHGRYPCRAEAASGDGVHLTTPCWKGGPSGSVVLHVADALASYGYSPLPDWIAMFVDFGFYGVNLYTRGCGPDDSVGIITYANCGDYWGPDGATGGCDLRMELVHSDGRSAAGAGLAWANAITHVPGPSGAEGSPAMGAEFVGGPEGGDVAGNGSWVCRPGKVSEYGMDPSNAATALLWKPSEVADVSFTLGVDGESNQGEVVIQLDLYGFYPAAPCPPPPPGNLLASPSPGGIVRRSRVLGGSSAARLITPAS